MNECISANIAYNLKIIVLDGFAKFLLQSVLPKCYVNI